ncbi:PH domain-containing protein [Leuconostoc lactis]|uniref:PH domain-containing protein n=1 Tax=Leuconostoc lactis TaxID=1246 RepID=UPI00272C1D2F|nr:PH domain-containing protein [Leuconostoc lactis]WKY78787.1 PH domain-containing protein [Leuconostoc lactis]
MTKPMRQSKFAVIAMVIQTAKDLLLPFVFVMLQGQRNIGQQALWTGGFLLVALVFGVVKWFFFTYELTPHEITVHQGVFVKRRTHVPFERVQTLTKTQPFIFQPFEVFQVRIETSGKADDLLTFNALTPAQIAAIEHYRQAAQTTSVGTTTTAQPQASATYQIDQRALIRYALTSFGSLGIIGVILTLLSEVSNHLPESVMAGLDHWLSGGSLMFYATLTAVVIFLGIGVAFLKIYNQYYGFTLTRVGQHLAIARGLLTKHTMQLRTTRVQAIQLEQSLLRRALRLVTVSVFLASAVKSDKNEAHQTVLMPVIQAAEATQVLRPFLPTLSLPALQPVKTAPHALRYQIQYTLWWGLGVLSFLLGSYWVLASHWHWHNGVSDTVMMVVAGVLLLVWLSAAWLRMRDQRLTIAGDILAIQTTPWFTKRQYYVRRDKIQGLNASQSIFMGPRQAQHLQVVVRHGDSAAYINLRYLHTDVVAQVRRWLIDVK